MAVMYLCLPVTTTACVIQVYLSLFVEPMVSPTSHLVEQAARYPTLMATQVYVHAYTCLIFYMNIIFLLLLTKQAPVFENCSCVAENIYHSSNESLATHQQTTLVQEYNVMGSSTAINGKCKTNCRNLGFFLLVVGMIVFLVFLLKIPTILVTIRY